MVVIARGLPRCCCAAIAARAVSPGTLSPSLLAYVGHPAYGLDALRCELAWFTHAELPGLQLSRFSRALLQATGRL